MADHDKKLKQSVSGEVVCIDTTYKRFLSLQAHDGSATSNTMSHEKTAHIGTDDGDLSVADDGAVFYADSDNQRVFVGEKGDNGATTYQDADGAPVEKQSPLGYSVGTWTAICLNVSVMVGTGIFSTREYLLIDRPAELNMGRSFLDPGHADDFRAITMKLNSTSKRLVLRHYS